MLIIPQPVRPGRRKRRVLASSEPTPAALTLVGATYEDGEPAVLVLVFDRAVDASAFDGSVVFVNDEAISGILWSGNGGWAQPTATTLRVTLLPVAAAEPGPVTMTTEGPTEIVAAEGGEAWAGVTDLELPFP